MKNKTPHTIPNDLRKTLNEKAEVLQTWNTLTPLAKNEWICWVVSVKKAETRAKHIVRLCEDIQNGKRRPCCWAGCTHRTRA